MTEQEVRSFVDRISCPGWSFAVVGRRLFGSECTDPSIVVSKHVKDSLYPRIDFSGFRSTIYPPVYGWTEETIVEELFAHLQFLADHELREWFTIRPHETIHTQYEPTVWPWTQLTYEGEYRRVIRPFGPHNPQNNTSMAVEFYTRTKSALLHKPNMSVRQR